MEDETGLSGKKLTNWIGFRSRFLFKIYFENCILKYRLITGSMPAKDARDMLITGPCIAYFPGQKTWNVSDTRTGDQNLYTGSMIRQPAGNTTSKDWKISNSFSSAYNVLYLQRLPLTQDLFFIFCMCRRSTQIDRSDSKLFTFFGSERILIIFTNKRKECATDFYNVRFVWE